MSVLSSEIISRSAHNSQAELEWRSRENCRKTWVRSEARMRGSRASRECMRGSCNEPSTEFWLQADQQLPGSLQTSRRPDLVNKALGSLIDKDRRCRATV